MIIVCSICNNTSNKRSKKKLKKEEFNNLYIKSMMTLKRKFCSILCIIKQVIKQAKKWEIKQKIK